jgi:opacity protein-like surface antigen
MKKLVLVALLVFAIATGVSAKSSIYIGGGISLPSGDAGDLYKTGFGAGIGIGFPVAPNFQIIPKVEFNTFAVDLGILDVAGVTHEGGSLSAFMFGADGRYSIGLPEAKVKPFFLGGLGMAIASVSDFTVSGGGESISVPGVSETKLYFNFGAGIEFAVSPTMNAFLQGRYVSIMTEGSSITFMPFTIGLKF